MTKRKLRKQRKASRRKAVKPTPGWISFLDGKRMYADGEPRPIPPTNENCHEAKAGYFYGWMMARAADVMTIIQTLRMCGFPEHGKSYERLLHRLVAALDKKHGLPDGHDTWANG